MTQTQIDAIRKIKEDNTEPKTREGKTVKPFVADTLCSFIEQSATFASSVMDEKKTLHGCIENMKLSELHVSDIDVYRAAVEYFLPGAIIEFDMRVKVPKSQTSANILELNFEDVFGFGGK